MHVNDFPTKKRNRKSLYSVLNIGIPVIEFIVCYLRDLVIHVYTLQQNIYMTKDMQLHMNQLEKKTYYS